MAVSSFVKRSPSISYAEVNKSGTSCYITNGWRLYGDFINVNVRTWIILIVIAHAVGRENFFSSKVAITSFSSRSLLVSSDSDICMLNRRLKNKMVWTRGEKVNGLWWFTGKIANKKVSSFTLRKKTFRQFELRNLHVVD